VRSTWFGGLLRWRARTSYHTDSGCDRNACANSHPVSNFCAAHHSAPMRWIGFTLSSYDVVFKVIKGRFDLHDLIIVHHVDSRFTRGQRSIDIWKNPKYSLKPRSFENRAQGFLQTTQEKLPAIRFNLLHR